MRLHMFQVPLRLRSTTARQPPSVISDGRAGYWPPALLTRKSMAPNSHSAVETRSSTCFDFPDVGGQGQASGADAGNFLGGGRERSGISSGDYSLRPQPREREGDSSADSPAAAGYERGFPGEEIGSEYGQGCGVGLHRAFFRTEWRVEYGRLAKIRDGRAEFNR